MARSQVIARVLGIVGWMLAGSTVLVLLVGAIGIRNRNTCSGIRITYTRPGGGRYVDSLRIAHLLNAGGERQLTGALLTNLDLNRMEKLLESDSWIRDADLFLDRGHSLHIRIEEQSPVARIFTRSGYSFYMDSQLNRIPLNPLYTERLPVFTGMPVSILGRQAGDTQHLADAWHIVRYLRSDDLAMAIVDQVDFEPGTGFVLIPKLGDHRIVFGNATDIAGKFRRLLIFYQQVMSHSGWNSYRQIDIRYRDQVVAIPSEILPAASDSLSPASPDTVRHPATADPTHLSPPGTERKPLPKAVMPAPRT
jgi:cell division protein FtsQ